MHRRSLLVAFTVACGLAQRGGLARAQDTGVLSGEEDTTLSFASEEPRRIIQDVVKGMGANHRVIEDRASAIYEAIAGARPREVVLIAGKGHEDYQEIRGKRLPFSDAEVARKALEGAGPEAQS